MNPFAKNGISRRQFLEATAAAMATSKLAGSAFAAQGSDSGGTGASARRPSLIRSENAKAGTTDWQLTRVRVVPGEGNTPQEAYRSVAIEGYCSRQSGAAGETIDLMIGTNPPARYGVEIFRTGYYGGRGARLMTTLGPFQGAKQPEPPVGEGRLRECRWAPSVSFKIAADCPGGVYLGRLTTLPAKSTEPYWQSYVVFIVRDERPVDILFQCSDNTWQAYNRWPGTYSLYDDGSAGMTTKRKIAASFDRPYGKYRQIYDNPLSTGSGEFLCWEFPLSYWLEQHGYDVAYCSNSDMLTPDRGLKCKCFVSVGHDEYWDLRQYHSVKAMIDAGVNALFLTGNAISGVTPVTPSSDGRPNRIITRVASYGGWGRSRAGAAAAPGDNQVEPGPDEGLLMGARNVSPVNGGGDWIVTKPNHWIFEGTGMKSGDRIPGLVGWEYHGNPADIPGLEVVAEGTAWKSGTVPQHWTATVHPGPKKNFVFNSATIFWVQGLSCPPGHMLPWSHWNRPHGPDERVQRIARNLLERALAR